MPAMDNRRPGCLAGAAASAFTALAVLVLAAGPVEAAAVKVLHRR
jgi:hypothetical protein